MKLRAFFGFLSPVLEYSKEDLSLDEVPLPEESIVLVPRAEGSQAPALSQGDSLRTGQRIMCKGGRFMGFSPVTGTIENIYDLSWVDGENFTAVTVRTADDDAEPLFKTGGDFLSLTKDDLLSRLEDAGLSIEIPAGSETCLVNFFERDLLLSNNRWALKSESEDLAPGIALMQKLCGNVVIAGPADLSDELEGLASSAQKLTSGIKGLAGKIEVRTAKLGYPKGMDALLPRSLYGKSSFAGAYTVVQAGKLLSIVQSLKSGLPCIERIITLIDRGENPVKMLKVRAGTRISDILSHVNLGLDEYEKVILSGPMRGRSVSLTDFPVTPETDAIFIQGASEVELTSSEPCLNCGKCAEVCPNKLQVNLLARYSEFNIFEKCEEYDIDYCIECGLCSYVCPCRRPLVQFIQFAKNQLEKQKREGEEE